MSEIYSYHSFPGHEGRYKTLAEYEALEKECKFFQRLLDRLLMNLTKFTAPWRHTRLWSRIELDALVDLHNEIEDAIVEKKAIPVHQDEEFMKFIAAEIESLEANSNYIFGRGMTDRERELVNSCMREGYKWALPRLGNRGNLRGV